MEFSLSHTIRVIDKDKPTVQRLQYKFPPAGYLSLGEPAPTLSTTDWKILQAKGVHPQQIYRFYSRALGLRNNVKSKVQERLGLPFSSAVPPIRHNFTQPNNQNGPTMLKCAQ